MHSWEQQYVRVCPISLILAFQYYLHRRIGPNKSFNDCKQKIDGPSKGSGAFGLNKRTLSLILNGIYSG